MTLTRPMPVLPGADGAPSRRLLIVNADDYGLTSRTSEMIVRLHHIGVVTSTTALVLAPGFAPTAHLLAGHPTLGTGVHLCLVGPDPPLSLARDIPTLVDRRGALASSWHFLLPRLLAGRVDLDDVRRELTAQIELALARGLRLTHLDSHQHLHLWPGISTVVMELALRYGIPAIRCPESRSYKTERPPVAFMSRRLRRQIRAAGLATTERFAGLDESGKAVAGRFDHVLDRVPAEVRSFEFGVHPNVAHDPDRDRYRWGRRGAEEAAGLSRPGLARELQARGWRLGSFAARPGGTRIGADPSGAARSGAGASGIGASGADPAMTGT
jgi:predicted glycoside hydrolase/deacetylase ChbG (UPF0249 family)